MNRRLLLKFFVAACLGLPATKLWAALKEGALSSIYNLLLDNDSSGEPSGEQYFRDRFDLDLSSIYWGDIHNHSNLSSDSTEGLCGALPNSIEQAFVYARDTAKLDFVSITDHAELRSGADVIGPLTTTWTKYKQAVETYNDEANFIVFPGWEYTNTVGLQPFAGSSAGYGHKNLMFKDITGLPSKMIGAFDTFGSNEIIVADTAQDLWEALGEYLPEADSQAPLVLTTIHTPAMAEVGNNAHNHQTDFDFMHSCFVRSIEIYSKWGNSEGYAPAEVSCGGSDTVIDYDQDNQVVSKTIRPLLYTKWVQENNSDFALGFSGGTDNHMGQPGNSQLDQCGFPYRGGVTGIAASAYNRSGLWQALYDRHALAATSDCRLGLLMAVEANGQHLLMGDVGAHNGTVRIRIVGDPSIDRLEILIDGCLKATISGHEADKTYTVSNSRHYIYVKAVKEPPGAPVQVVWTSPVYLSV